MGGRGVAPAVTCASQQGAGGPGNTPVRSGIAQETCQSCEVVGSVATRERRRCVRARRRRRGIAREMRSPCDASGERRGARDSRRGASEAGARAVVRCAVQRAAAACIARRKRCGSPPRDALASERVRPDRRALQRRAGELNQATNRLRLSAAGRSAGPARCSAALPDALRRGRAHREAGGAARHARKPHWCIEGRHDAPERARRPSDLRQRRAGGGTRKLRQECGGGRVQRDTDDRTVNGYRGKCRAARATRSRRGHATQRVRGGGHECPLPKTGASPPTLGGARAD